MRCNVFRRTIFVWGMVICGGCDGVKLGVGAGQETAGQGSSIPEGQGVRVQGDGQFQCGSVSDLSVKLGQENMDGFFEFSDSARSVLVIEEGQRSRAEVAVRVEGRISHLETVGIGLVIASDERVIGMGTQYRPLLTCDGQSWSLPPIVVELQDGQNASNLAAANIELVGEFRFIDGDEQPTDVVLTYPIELSP